MRWFWLLLPVWAYLLDWLIGDPEWLFHPVVWLGRLITRIEKRQRRQPGFLDSAHKQQLAGLWLVIGLSLLIFASTCILAFLLSWLSPFLGAVFTLWFAAQGLATRSLLTEVRRAFHIGRKQDLPALRRQTQRIVGRQTKDLDEPSLIIANLESLSENFSDGVVAPLFWLAFAGLPGLWFYKLINTLDSMIGYRTEAYQYYGKVAARLDDLLNYIPARLSAFILLLTSYCFRSLSSKQAWRTYLKDRKAHLSPNAGQTESVAAGALGLQFGGAHCYNGEWIHKPLIGQFNRKPTFEQLWLGIKWVGLSSVCALGVLTLARLFLWY